VIASRRFARIAALAAALAPCGCATVEAWERQRLAEPHMSADPEPAQSEYRNHVYQSREAAPAGGAGAGGGCGCY
jgi:hypothetical protein